MICLMAKKYHKGNKNPVYYLTHSNEALKLFKKKHKNLKIQEYLKQIAGTKSGRCELKNSYHKCQIYSFMKNKYSSFADKCLQIFEKKLEAIRWQWLEVVDIMFEKPHLVNINGIDEYVIECIYNVCEEYNKENPFEEGISEKFGKYWKDKNGEWHPERRNRG